MYISTIYFYVAKKQIRNATHLTEDHVAKHFIKVYVFKQYS